MWKHVVSCTCSGDREKREGLEVSPMMDRDLINLCNMQLGFIEFVVSPLIVGRQLIHAYVRLKLILSNNFQTNHLSKCWGLKQLLV